MNQQLKMFSWSIEMLNSLTMENRLGIFNTIWTKEWTNIVEDDTDISIELLSLKRAFSIIN